MALHYYLSEWLFASLSDIILTILLSVRELFMLIFLREVENVIYRV